MVYRSVSVRERLTALMVAGVLGLAHGGGAPSVHAQGLDDSLGHSAKHPPTAATRGPSAPTVAPAPQLQSITPDGGRAGDVVSLLGIGLAASPAEHRVAFRASDGSGIAIPAPVIEVVPSGTDPMGNPITRLDVVVPTGVRSSDVFVDVEVGDQFVSAGSVGFAAAPVIVGAIYGSNNQGYAFFDPFGGFFPGHVTLYGYNLAGLTEVTFFDEIGELIPSPTVSIAPTGPPLPPGVDAINAQFPSSGFALFDCLLAARLGVRAESTIGPSNHVELRIRKALGGNPGDFPATISGVVLPSGVLSGDVTLEFHLLSLPSSETWNVVPQYLDPVSGSFSPCTPRSSSAGVGLLPGTPEHRSSRGMLIGPGHPHTFTWDTEADFPGQRVATRLRLVPFTADPPFPSCIPTRWDTEWVSIDNTPPLEHAIVEEFVDTEFLAIAETDADWSPALGVLRGTGSPATTPSMFGAGTLDVVLLAGRDYLFLTDSAELLDVTNSSQVIDLIPSNPGAPLAEFHVRSLIVEPTARVEVSGVAPLVIRCSGVGNVGATVASLGAAFDLAGEDGGNATLSVAGEGGRGGPGGGDGGDGAAVVANPVVFLISGFQAATAGHGPAGGEPGESSTFIKPFGPVLGSTQATGGSGGGGGNGTRGMNGLVVGGGVFERVGQSGRGGPAVGDSAVTLLRGGSGGGGGGASLRRTGSGQLATPKRGGGGGGGGGAFELVADGSILITARVNCDGGRGGASTVAAGPISEGGAGSGGTIVVRATGFIRVASGQLVTARGGATQTAGGTGGAGRIRLDAAAAKPVVARLDLTGVTQPVGSPPNVSFAQQGIVIDGGTGADGALDLSAESGQFVVDTQTGVITDPFGGVRLVAASGGGEFRFTRLLIPPAVTLRGVGPNPLVLRISEFAEIDGVIDVSGFDGGLPDFTDPANPTAGVGGAAGPGGGRGGDGGFADGVSRVAGGDGELPPDLPPELRAGFTSPEPTGLPVPLELATPAGGGRSIDGPNACPAGPGGGGAFGTSGSPGITSCAPPGGVGATSGARGTRYGWTSFVNPITGDPLRLGGSGGGGGGGELFAAGMAVAHSPGSGGGGGGGFLQISTPGSLRLGITARILARGGTAFRAAVAGGNAGGGAGGGILLQAGLIDIAAAEVSVAAGLSNVIPTSATYLPNALFGAGGEAGDGRLRIESPAGFVEGDSECAGVIAPGTCPPASVGRFEIARATVSRAVSLAYPVVRDGVRFKAAQFLAPILSPPPGESLPFYRVLFAGARERADASGVVGEFGDWSDDPASLEGADFVRFLCVLYGDETGSSQPIVDRLEFPFEQ